MTAMAIRERLERCSWMRLLVIAVLALLAVICGLHLAEVEGHGSGETATLLLLFSFALILSVFRITRRAVPGDSLTPLPRLARATGFASAPTLLLSPPLRI